MEKLLILYKAQILMFADPLMIFKGTVPWAHTLFKTFKARLFYMWGLAEFFKSVTAYDITRTLSGTRDNWRVIKLLTDS